MNKNVVVLTRGQRDTIIAAFLPLLRKQIWEKYHTKPQDMNDYVNDGVLYFLTYKDGKYRPTIGADIEEEKRKYRNYFLYTTLQNMGTFRTKQTKIEVHYIPTDFQVFEEESPDTVATESMQKFLRDYSDIDSVMNVEAFFDRLISATRSNFRYEVARKIRYYIAQWRKGNKVKWERYFHGKYSSMKSAVVAQFKAMCKTLAADVDFQFA